MRNKAAVYALLAVSAFLFSRGAFAKSTNYQASSPDDLPGTITPENTGEIGLGDLVMYAEPDATAQYGDQMVTPDSLPVENSDPISLDDLIGNVAAHLIQKEGFRPYVYDDVNGLPWTQSQRGNPTIGYGHKLLPGEPFDWTVDSVSAYQLLIQDIKKNLIPIIGAVKVPLSVPAWVAITSLAFNAGGAAVKKSKFIRALNAGDLAQAEYQFKDWNKARVNGVLTEVKGLTNRRAEEWALLTTPAPVVYLA